MSQFNNAIEEVANGINESVNAGFRRLGDLLTEALEQGGAQQATAFEVTVNGTSNIFVSPDDARLDAQVNPAEVTISKVNSATAGC